MLTIYALAHDSNSTEDVYISLHDKVKLYIKLTDDLGKTLVEQSVTSLKPVSYTHLRAHETR